MGAKGRGHPRPFRVKGGQLASFASIRFIGDDVGVTVVDERSPAPKLDEEKLDRLGAALDRDGVVAAMLIGSQAREDAGPLSDVDVGVWHQPDLDALRRRELQLGLATEASRTLGTDEINIVLLNRATPLMQHRAIRDGRRLVDRDPDERVRLETKAVLRYLDTARLRSELARGLRLRIEEGRFGRR